MATAILPAKPRSVKASGQFQNRLVLNGRLQIPALFADLDAFRLWCKSSDYPENGDVFWLEGTIWVSDEMEDFSTHNAIKTEVLTVLNAIVKANKLGFMFSDRMRLVHEKASLSVEPDVMYASLSSIENRRVLLEPNENERILEVEGSPDMVLEVVSDSSVSKDAELESTYFNAGVQEYWRIDARGDALKFEILRRGSDKFVPTPRRKGRLKSAVFDRSFELNVKEGLLGIPEYTLEASE